MINIQELSSKHKVFLIELVRRIAPELNIGPATLNSLKPGVIQFCFNNINLHPRKKKVIEKIMNKIIHPQMIDGELVEIKEEIKELKSQNYENI